MFEKQIRITGKHADIMRKYSKDKQGENEKTFVLTDRPDKPVYIFDTMLQCYMVAAMIGINTNKTAEVDNTKTTPANIFADILAKNRSNLMRIYQHMILSSANSENIDSKIKEAFKVNIDSDHAEKMLDSYVRGGLEVIDQYFVDCTNIENLTEALDDLISDFSIRNKRY